MLLISEWVQIASRLFVSSLSVPTPPRQLEIRATSQSRRVSSGRSRSGAVFVGRTVCRTTSDRQEAAAEAETVVWRGTLAHRGRCCSTQTDKEGTVESLSRIRTRPEVETRCWR